MEDGIFLYSSKKKSIPWNKYIILQKKQLILKKQANLQEKTVGHPCIKLITIFHLVTFPPSIVLSWLLHSCHLCSTTTAHPCIKLISSIRFFCHIKVYIYLFRVIASQHHSCTSWGCWIHIVGNLSSCGTTCLSFSLLGHI